MDNFSYPGPLVERMQAGFKRLDKNLAEAAPAGSRLFEAWYADYYGTKDKTAPFLHSAAFPLFLLPWHLEESTCGRVTPAFQEDLIYSSLCGYHYIRIIDNIMDNEANLEKEMMPLLHFFHTEFLTAYSDYFPYDHQFWKLFKKVWYNTADVTAADSKLTHIGYKEFTQIAAAKTAAVKIPLAAVAFYHKQIENFDSWQDFLHLLGSFHQLHNDLFDWQKDFDAASPTYFLCESKRIIEEENLTGDMKEHIASKGLPWGFGLLLKWLGELEEKARLLSSPGLSAYFKHRSALLEEKKRQISAQAERAQALKSVLEKHGINLK